ncbi:MAG TPA: DUF885 family protein [Polyangia bacterium]
MRKGYPTRLDVLGLVVAAGALFFGLPGCSERASSKAQAGSKIDLGSGLSHHAAPELPRDPNARLEALEREDLDAELQESPTLATWLGARGHDDQLDDVRIEAQGRRVARLRALLPEIVALDDQALDATHRIDKRLFTLRCQDALFDLTTLHPLESNPLIYVDLASSGIEELLDEEPTSLPDRLRSIDARLWKIRPLLDEARRNLRSAGAAELKVRKAIELAQSAKSYFAETLPKAVQLADPKLMEDFHAADADASHALDDFSGWLQKDLLPRAKGDFALGRDRLLEKLRVAEGLDGVTPEELVAAGERELKAARARYDAASKLVLASAKPGADLTKVIEDDHFKADELQLGAQAAAEAIVAFLRDQHLVTLPAPPRPRVVDMPPSLWGFAQLAAPRPLEPKAREAFLYIDPVDKGWPERRKQEQLRTFNRATMRVTLLHQVAGHYLEAMRDRAAPTTMEKIALAPSFVEGWPDYVEKMMVEQGFGDSDPKLELIEARSQMVRDARLVAVVRLHALSAKLDDATKVFTDEAELDDYQARREAERCAIDPMVMLDALGRIEIEKLRDDWQAAHEASPPSLGAFHDALLAHGTPPVTILRKILLPGDSGSPL